MIERARQPYPVFIDPESPVLNVYDGHGIWPVPVIGATIDFGLEHSNSMHGAWKVIGQAPDTNWLGERYIRCYVRKVS